MNSKTECAALRVERPAPHVKLIKLNRQEVANAINTQMTRELITQFENLAIDAGEIRCVVITGKGDKYFCAGGDLKERNNMANSDWYKQHLLIERMVRAVLNCPLPIIAAINATSSI